jgi:alpha-glucosidase
MRRFRLARVLGGTGLLAALAWGCGDASSEPPSRPPASPPSAPPGQISDAPACGEADGLPPGAARDDATRTLTVSCDAEPGEVAVTALDDGLVRLRYGRDARGSIVALERPPARAPLRLGRRGAAALLCSPELEVEITPGACRVSAKDVATGAVVLEDGERGGFFRASVVPAGERIARDVVGVARRSPPDERIYGLGLHADAGHGLDLRRRVIELRNTDAYDAAAGGFRADAELLYESIPFYLGLRGRAAYGVFTDDTHRMRFDLASTDPEHVRAMTWGGAIDQYLVAGPSLRDVLRRYTLLTGRAPLPAPWAIGFHQSRWEGPCDGAPAERPFCSAAQISALAQKLRDAGVPADGLFLDIQHMDGYRSFTFDPIRFADPDALASALASLGFHLSAIVDPGIKIDPAWSVYQSGVAGGHFLTTPAGDVFQGEVWPGAAAFPDFTAPKTRAWWSDLVAREAARGVRGLWIDMNEPSSFTTGTAPDELVVDGDGRRTTMTEAHNAYAFFEAKASFEGMRSARPNERPFLLSRAAFAGQQRYSAVWTGDAPSTWTTLAATLPQLLQLGMSGMAFAGSDVGGYSGRAESTADLFSRWMALGAVSPFFRAHAEKDARRQEPWSFGDDVLDAARELVGLRYALLPYLYSAFEETARTGAPVLRPLVFEFQDDEEARDVGDEAMLGPSLLVAPILSTGASARSVYLPPGRWFELRSGAAFEGGKRIAIAVTGETLPMDALPLFARAGAIVPRTEVAQTTEAARKLALVVDVFPSEAKTTFSLYEDDGAASPAWSRVAFTFEPTTQGARLSAGAREGSYAPPRPRTLARLRRVDHPPAAVTLDGAPLARVASADLVGAGQFAWDAIDRALVVELPARAFSLEAAYDRALLPDGDVTVDLRVELPAGTPTATPIHVASSLSGWAHAPMQRSGDVATATLGIPRGAWAFFKITRGSWPTVEKSAGCVEKSNRHVLGAARAAPLAVRVATWADACP